MRDRASAFGLTLAQWTTAKKELRQGILDSAWRRQMTWYGEIASKVSVVPVQPYSELMNQLLAEISEDEHAADRPMLTSIVTHKDGDKEPGDGFYRQAQALGLPTDDRLVLWSTQVQMVFKLHGRPERSPTASS